jgi:ferredoxin
MNFTCKRDCDILQPIRKTMANPADRLIQNAAGKYFVDGTCIDCNLCREIAPAVFGRDDEIGFSIVQRQPLSPDEIALAEEARESCPVDAIGNNGEPA